MDINNTHIRSRSRSLPLQNQIMDSSVSTEMLIALVYANRALWDTSDPRFRLVPLKMQIFNHIGEALGGIDGETAQRKWRNVKDRYVKERKKEWPPGRNKRQWPLMEKLTFLDAVVKSGPSPLYPGGGPTKLDASDFDESSLLYGCSDRLKVEMNGEAVTSYDRSTNHNDDDDEIDVSLTTSEEMSTWEHTDSKRKRHKKSVCGLRVEPPDARMTADQMFCMSMCEALTRLDTRTKAKLKCDITQLFYDAEFPTRQQHQ